MIVGGAQPSAILVQARVTGASLVAGSSLSVYMTSTVFIGLPFRVTSVAWTTPVTRATGTKTGADCLATYTGGTNRLSNFTLAPLNGACNITSGVVFSFKIPQAYAAENPSSGGYYSVTVATAGALSTITVSYGTPAVVYATAEPRNADDSAIYLAGGRQPSFLNIGFTVTRNITSGAVIQLVSTTSYAFRGPGSTAYAIPITGTGCTATLTTTGTDVTNQTMFTLSGSSCMIYRNQAVEGSQFQLPAALLNVNPIDTKVTVAVYITVGSAFLFAYNGNPTYYTTTNECTAWSAWSSCSATCGTGYTYRTRTGDPAYCATTIASRACNTVSCGCALWSDWGSCSATCGGNVSRYRLGSVGCNVPTVDTQTCGPTACSCPWTQTTCSSSCGSGVRTRTVTPVGPADCGAALQYDVVCNETFTTEALSCGCQDVAWTDLYGFSCQDYANNQWCNSSGYGPGWDFSQPGFSSFDARGKNGNIAPSACCACGKNKCVKDVVLLIDQSASISLSDWAKTKQYVYDRVNQTAFTNENGNRFAVVQFDVAASVLCPLTWNQTFLLNCIAAITFPAGSYTATSAGLDLANVVLSRYSSPGRTRVVELLTDGSPNLPTFNPDAAAYTSAYALKDAGVVVITIGMGVPCPTGIPLSDDCLNREVLNTIASDPASSYAVLLASYDWLGAMSGIVSAQCTPELDAGSIGGFAWEDVNANGLVEAGEPGLGNVTVTLLSCVGAALSTTTTAANGSYTFLGVPPGSYEVAFANLANTANSTALTTPPFPLPSGTNRTDVAVGLYFPPSAAGTVWDDLNADGVWGAGEPGRGGVAVTLQSCDGTVLRTTTTDASGAYAFAGLVPGAYYRVAVPTPTGAGPTTATATACFTLLSRDAWTAAPIGFYRLIPVGDRVWEDLNANGLQDAGEPGLGNVTVALLTCNGTVVSTTVSASNGYYVLFAPAPATYRVAFVTPAGGFNSTATATPCFSVVVGGPNKTDADAGFYFLGSVGDFVWLDYNPDGIQGPTEPGFPGITVVLRTCGGALLRTATTNGNGRYLISGLVPSVSYKLQLWVPFGFWAGPSKQGQNASLDSDFDTNTFLTSCFTVTSRQAKLDMDGAIYGYFQNCGLAFASNIPDNMSTSSDVYSVPSAQCFPHDAGSGGWILPQDPSVRQTGATVMYGLWLNAAYCQPVRGRNIGSIAVQWVTNTTVTVTYLLPPGFSIYIPAEYHSHDVYVGNTLANDVWMYPTTYLKSTIQLSGTNVTVREQTAYNYSITISGLTFPATDPFYVVVFGNPMCLNTDGGGGVIGSSAPDAAHLAAASSGPGSSAIVWVGLGVGVAVAAVLAAAAGYVWWWHSPRGHALRVDTLFASQNFDRPASPPVFNTAHPSVAVSPQFSPVVSPSARQLDQMEKSFLLAAPAGVAENGPVLPATPANVEALPAIAT
eukprot:EG_transcript_233